MLRKKTIMIIVLIMLVSFVCGDEKFSYSVNTGGLTSDQLSPASSIAPIAVVEKNKKDLIVLKDDRSKHLFTSRLGTEWGFLYLNRFISSILKDFKGDIGQDKIREIYRAHFPRYNLANLSWRDIYKKERSFYLYYSMLSAGEKKSDLVLKYDYEESSGKVFFEISDDPGLADKFMDKVDTDLTATEIKEAERILTEIKRIVYSHVMNASPANFKRVMRDRGLDQDPIVSYWLILEEINKKNPLFSPEAFAEEFIKYYPSATEEAQRILKYTVAQLGQGKYADIFLKAFIRREHNIGFVLTGELQFKKYISQVKFIPELSRMVISERSLSIMEYLNEELDFVDPVEFRSLMSAAEKIHEMAHLDIRVDQKQGDFIGFVKELHSMVMPGKKFEFEKSNFRMSECLSSGRPRIFPPGAVRVASRDMVEFELETAEGLIVKKISLNSMLADILTANYPGSRQESLEIKDSDVIHIMNEWIWSNTGDRTTDKAPPKDLISLVTFFLGKKIDSPDKYLISDEKVQVMMEDYFIKKSKEVLGREEMPSGVRARRVIKEKIYLIEELMLMLEKRIMSDEFKSQHPVAQASEVYLTLIDIHPYSDGNERLARLLLNYYLLVNGFPVLEIYPGNREEFVKTVRFVSTKEEFAMFLAEHLMLQNQFMIKGKDTFYRVTPAEMVVEDHLDIFPDGTGVYEALSEEVRRVVKTKSKPVMLTSFGVTLKEFYSKVLMRKAWLSPGDDDFIDLRGVTFVLSDEFVGTDNRYKSFLEDFIYRLPERNRPLRVIGFSGDTSFEGVQALSQGDKIYRFNEVVDELSGIDFALMSIGINGHIAYNEMGSPFYSRGRIVGLHKSTIEHRHLGYTRAFTVGISDILSADRVVTIGVSSGEDIVAVNGDVVMSKTDAINKSIFTLDVPASFIRFKENRNFRFIIDSETAGSDLNWIKRAKTGFTNGERRHTNEKMTGSEPLTAERSSEKEVDLSYYADAAKTFYDYLLTVPYAAGTGNENIIVGIDKSWIPEIGWLNRVVKQISRMGSASLHIETGRGSELAGILSSKARELGIDRTTIILLGAPGEYKSDGYKGLLEADIRNKTFIALIDGRNLQGLSTSGEANYIMIMKWIESAIKMAFSDNPIMVGFPGLEKAPEKITRGIWTMVPRANLMDIGTLLKIHKIERDVLKNL